jgi:hypothetical protein
MVGTPRKKREPIIVAMGMRAGTLAFFILLGGRVRVPEVLPIGNVGAAGALADEAYMARSRSQRRALNWHPIRRLSVATPVLERRSDSKGVLREMEKPCCG